MRTDIVNQPAVTADNPAHSVDNAASSDAVARFQNEMSAGGTDRSALYSGLLDFARQQRGIAAQSNWSVNRESNTISLDNGYRISLNEASSQLLLEKVDSNGKVERATRIWGDPHIDVGNNGKNNADFYKDTSLLLEDGTKITIGTRSKGSKATYSDTLTITKGDKAIEVSGLMSGADALSIGDVTMNGKELDAATNDGHIMFETGDDWSVNGRAINEDGAHFIFGEEEIQKEVEWLEVGARHAERGAELPENLAQFLSDEGIRIRDYGSDGVLSSKEWDRLMASIETHQTMATIESDQRLALLLNMLYDFDKDVDEEVEGETTNAIQSTFTPIATVTGGDV